MGPGVNHCLLEVEVLEPPQVRYTQDNQTPVAEMAVRFEGLRPDDPPGQIKAVGWGSVAQDLQNRVVAGQRLLLEGRLRMNTVSRPDGIKEKRAEFTLSRFHPVGGEGGGAAMAYPEGGARPAAPPQVPAPASGGRAAAAAPVRRPQGGAPGRAGAEPAAPVAEPRPEVPVWNPSPLVADPGGFDGPLEDDDIPF